MYQARLHPEQYSNTFSDTQVKKLHDAMMYVCNTAVDTLAESDKFPEDWLMKYRWSKGKKDANILPNGAKITFLKVGGRTSAIVPSVQKKTGAVAGDISENVSEDEMSVDAEIKEETKAKKPKKRKAQTKDDEGEEAVNGADEAVLETKKQKKAVNGTSRGAKKASAPVESKEASGRRRSGRSKATVDYAEKD